MANTNYIKMQERKILILGGTNFMGKALLDGLSAQQPAPVVVCINRGKIYWNNQARKQHPEVLYFYCDRKEHLDTTATVNFVSKHLKIDQHNKWSCVVDFSAFRWRDVQSVTKAIADISEKYIFISSDSLYNNSPQRREGPVREEQFNIEEQYRRIKASEKSRDSYGYNKLKCELYLNRVKPLAFACLRLPDVIGPYDNTERFWGTVKWVRESGKYPIPITAQDQSEKMSLVDSVSVANQIIKMIAMQRFPSNAYNLGSLESVTIKQLVDSIANAIDPEMIVEFRAEKKSNHFYPSVQFGTIDSSKARRQVGWAPVLLSEAIRNAVNFFVLRGSNYAEQRKEMEKQFKKKVIGKSN